MFYPGSRQDTIAVGAVIGGRTLWGASGKGPSYKDVMVNESVSIVREYFIKPDFVAPGLAIRSAFSVRDNQYQRLTGTSMATPHVAGAFALLLQIKRQMSSILFAENMNNTSLETLKFDIF